MNLTYADKPWLAHYDEGVAESVPLPDKPLDWYLAESARQKPDNVAIVFQGNQINYRDLDAAAGAVAAGLVANGFKKGDRAVIYMPNIPQFMMIYFGILRAGGIVIATNPLYTERELQHQLQDCGAETVFVMSRYYPLLKNVQRQGKTQVKRIIVTHLKSYLPGVKRILYGLLREKKSGDAVTLEAGDISFKDFLTIGVAGRQGQRSKSQATIWRCCSTQAAPPVSPKALSPSIATWPQMPGSCKTGFPACAMATKSGLRPSRSFILTAW